MLSRFYQQWSMFSSTLSLTSAQTCLFGDCVVKTLLQEIPDYISVFFTSREYRNMFIKHLTEHYNIQYHYYDTENVCISLVPNSKDEDSLCVYLMLSKSMMVYNDVAILEIGPYGTLEPGPGTFLHSSVSTLTKTLQSIYKKECRLVVLSLDTFSKQYTIDTGGDKNIKQQYTKYWQMLFQYYLPKLKSTGWTVVNVNKNTVCDCDGQNSFQHIILENNDETIIYTCDECTSKIEIFDDFQ